MPLILFILIFRNRNKLDNINTIKKYFILYQDYNDKMYFWEFIKMLEKIIIMIIASIITNSTLVKSILIIIVLCIY